MTGFSTSVVRGIAIVLLMAGLAVSPAVAQDVTPESEECAVTSVEENIAHAISYVEAVASYDGSDEAGQHLVDHLHGDFLHSIHRSEFGEGIGESAADSDVIAAAIARVAETHERFPETTHIIVEAIGNGDHVVIERMVTISNVSVDGEVVELENPVEFLTYSTFEFACGVIVSEVQVLDRDALSDAISSELESDDEDEG